MSAQNCAHIFSPTPVCFSVFNQGKISHVDDDNLLVSTGGGQNGSPFIFIHMLSIAGRSSALNQGSAFCLPPRGPWIRASFLPSSSTYLAERTNRSSSWNFSPLMMMVRDAQSKFDAAMMMVVFRRYDRVDTLSFTISPFQGSCFSNYMQSSQYRCIICDILL